MRRCCAAPAALLALLGAAAPAPAARRPNFLFLLIDDLGWNDIGFRGLPEDRVAGGHAEFETPNIDALAREAVMLNDYYINKFCSPTRSSLMSGRCEPTDHLVYMSSMPGLSELTIRCCVRRDLQPRAQHVHRRERPSDRPAAGRDDDRRLAG